MKNTTTIIYATIISILLVTVFFTIAELNIVAKSEYTNHLEQTVVMTASYLIICKLLIQIAITYILGNMLYNMLYNKIYKSKEVGVARIKSTTVDTTQLDKTLERLDKYDKDRKEAILQPTQEYRSPVYRPEMKIEPIISNDDFDKIEKALMESIIDEPINYKTLNYPMKLSKLLCGISMGNHTFSDKEIRDNKEYKLVGSSASKIENLKGIVKTERIYIGDMTYYFDVVVDSMI